MISDPRFEEMQFSHAVKNPGHLYELDSLEREMYYLERVSDGVESMKISNGIESMKTSQGYFMGQPRSAGGLLAVMMPRNECHICNPIIGEKVIVPMYPYPDGCFRIGWWGFGYSSITKEYRIALFGLTVGPPPNLNLQVAIYTLGSRSWKEIPSVPISCIPWGVVECDGTLFWWMFSDNSLVTILSFDIWSGEFRHWRGPYSGIHDEFNHLDFSFGLFKFVDTVAVFRRQGLHYTIWALRDKVNETWIKEYDIEPNPSESTFWPMGLWMNRELLMVRHSGWSTYDPNSRVFKELPIPFKEERIYKCASIMISHVGCLFSPRRVAIDT